MIICDGCRQAFETEEDYGRHLADVVREAIRGLRPKLRDDSVRRGAPDTVKREAPDNRRFRGASGPRKGPGGVAGTRA